MRSKSVVYLFTGLLVVGFAAMLFYGWTNKFGPPVAESHAEEPLVVSIGQLERSLTLAPNDFDDDVWSELTPVKVPLLYQVTAIPWPSDLVPELAVRAFHDGDNAYFLLEWEDEVESRFHDVGIFPDGVAISFSLANDTPPESIMMGFKETVNIWMWKASLDTQYWQEAPPLAGSSPNDYYTYTEAAAFPDWSPEIDSACQDLIADKPGTLTLKEDSELNGRGQWSQGKWRVLIKRSLTTAGNPEADVQLGSGEYYAAFAVWNGDKGDRGSRKSISNWVILNIKPGAVSESAELSETQSE